MHGHSELCGTCIGSGQMKTGTDKEGNPKYSRCSTCGGSGNKTVNYPSTPSREGNDQVFRCIKCGVETNRSRNQYKDD
jgi:hypothetical protein